MYYTFFFNMQYRSQVCVSVLITEFSIKELVAMSLLLLHWTLNR